MCAAAGLLELLVLPVSRGEGGSVASWQSSGGEPDARPAPAASAELTSSLGRFAVMMRLRQGPVPAELPWHTVEIPWRRRIEVRSQMRAGEASHSSMYAQIRARAEGTWM